MNLENILMLREFYQLLQEGIITDDDFNFKKAEFIAKSDNIVGSKIKLHQELSQLAKEGIISQEEYGLKKQSILNYNAAKVSIHSSEKDKSQEMTDSNEDLKTDQIIDIQKIIKAGKSLKVVLVVSVLFPLISTIGFFLVQSNVKSAENLQLWIIIFGVFSLLGYVVIISNFYNAADYLENPLKKKKG